MGKVFAFATFVVGGLIVADLWSHYRLTSQVVKAGVTESKLLAGK